MRGPTPQVTAPRGYVRETLRHAAIYSGAGILGRLISFFMLPFYAHILRDIGYGVIGMIDAGLVLLSSLLGYNFHGAVLRIYHEEDGREQKNKVITTGIMLVAAITGALVALTLPFSRPLSNVLLGTSAHWNLICLAMGAFWLDMIGQTAQSALVIERQSVAFSLIGIVRLLVGVALNILLIVILRWGLTGYFLAALLTAAVGAGLSLVLGVRHRGFAFDREIAGKLLRFQMPLIPGSLTTFASRQVERVLVRFQIDIATLGVLEMAYKFPVLINVVIAQPFIKSWNTKRMETAEEPDAPRRAGDMFAYFLFLLMLGGLLIAVNIRTVLELLTPPEFWEAYRIARIEVMSVILAGCYVYLSFGLYYTKRTGTIARIRMTTAVGKVGISYVMISHWGLYGAAYSGLITSLVTTVWAYTLARRYYRDIIDWRKIGLVVGAAVTLYLLIDSFETAQIAGWAAPLSDWGAAAVAFLEGTPLGAWKDGKVIQMLEARGDLILELIVKTLFAASYLVVLPLVRTETHRALARAVTRLYRRSQV